MKKQFFDLHNGETLKNKLKKENQYCEESPIFNEPKNFNKFKDNNENLVNYKDTEFNNFNENISIKEENNNVNMNNISQHKENEDYNNLMNDMLDENYILKKNEKLIND